MTWREVKSYEDILYHKTDGVARLPLIDRTQAQCVSSANH